MRVIAVANQKGGCGKTTTAINLGASLSFLGKKVLLIDFDPQAHSTLGLGINADQLEKSIFDVLNPESPEPLSLREVTIQIEKSLWLVPSQIVLTAIEQQLSGKPKREERLLACVATVRKNYDFVLIDCPPNLGLLTFNALRAASEAVIPIEPSTFSIHGLDKINETLQLLRDKIQHVVTVHALLTMYDHRNRFVREMVEQVRLIYGSQVLRTVIRTNIRLREAARAGRPITRFDRHATGFHDYLSLASEMIERASQLEDQAVSAIQAHEQALNKWIEKGTQSSAAESIREEDVSIATPSDEIRAGHFEEEEFSGTQKTSEGLAGEEEAEPAEESYAEAPILEDESHGKDLASEPLEQTIRESVVGGEESRAGMLSVPPREPAVKEPFSDSAAASFVDKAAPSTASQRVPPSLEEKTVDGDQGKSSVKRTAKPTSPLKVIKGIRRYPLKVSGGYLFICKCPQARAVQIVGDFTNWIAVNMNSPGGRTGFWTRVFSLTPGQYKYKFIIDGEWLNDVNNAKYERNPYGGIDSVLEVTAG